jgi:hypothetical protein
MERSLQQPPTRVFVAEFFLARSLLTFHSLHRPYAMDLSNIDRKIVRSYLDLLLPSYLVLCWYGRMTLVQVGWQGQVSVCKPFDDLPIATFPFFAASIPSPPLLSRFVTRLPCGKRPSIVRDVVL